MVWAAARQRVCAGLIACLLAALAAEIALGAAVAAQEPQLRHRGGSAHGKQEQKPADENVTRTVAEAKSPLTLPADSGGEYVFGKPGEFIEIIFQEGLLHGYMSRESGAGNDRGAPLTYYFSHTIVDGARISFTTYVIHGSWYSFEGTIVSGTAKSLSEDGMYRLAGSLVMHDESGKTEQRRVVNLKLSRRM